MYFHNLVGTGSYTTSTTNMYNMYNKYLFLPNVHAARDDREWVTHQHQSEPQRSWFAQRRATDAKGKQNHKRRRYQHFHTLFLESG
jgi:hypothetical protein